jgi:hypothetical protein
LHRLLPHDDEASTSQTLRYIDWYGDTIFNHLQAVYSPKPVVTQLRSFLGVAHNDGRNVSFTRHRPREDAADFVRVLVARRDAWRRVR